MLIEVIGVYSVQAHEPCHLVELWIRGLIGALTVGEFTQEVEGQPRDNWQVPYDERVLNQSGTVQIEDPFPQEIENDGGDVRLAFFFRYLDFARPLETPIGPVPLPAATTKPSRLHFLKYE